MTAGIYRLINNRTGEVYVGQSHNVYARWGSHLKELGLGTHHNKGLQEDHDRGDTFTFEILEKIPNPTKYDLNEKEKYYIEKFNSYNEGYNRTLGGEHDEDKGRSGVGDRLPSYKYKPVPKQELLEKCPNCGGELVKRKGDYGNFAGCSNYPKCKFTCPVKKVNFKPKKLPSHVSTKYDSNTYVPPVKSVPCKFCGKLIKDIYTICPFCNELLTESPQFEQKTPLKTKNKRKTNKEETKVKPIEYGEPLSDNIDYCRYCGGEIAAEDKFCVNCGEKLVGDTGIEEIKINTSDSVIKEESTKLSVNNTTFCSGCGCKIDSEDLYCSNCGEKLVGDTGIEEIKINTSDSVSKEESTKLSVNNTTFCSGCGCKIDSEIYIAQIAEKK